MFFRCICKQQAGVLLVVTLLGGGDLPTYGQEVEPTFRRSLDRVASIDPIDASSTYAGRAVQLVYEPLLEVDYFARPYQLRPCLARTMPEISADGLVYTFKLDPAAVFHPHICFGLDQAGNPRGRRIVAEDLVFSLKRLADRRLVSPGEWLVLDTIVGMRNFSERSMEGSATDYNLPVAGLEALDCETLRITLNQPTHQFIWYLAMGYTSAVAHEAVQYYGAAFGSFAVGSGPYHLTQWRRNHQMVYERVPTWRGWHQGVTALKPGGAEVPFERIIYSVIDDVSTQWLCFLTGELDFLGEIARDNWDVVIDGSGSLQKPLQERGIKMHSIASLQVAYIGINMDDPILGSNRPLRQALNCAFDSQTWNNFYNQRTLTCDGPVPPGTDGRLESDFAYAFNLEKARQLLHEAGYPDGIDPATGKRLELTLDLGRTSQDVRESTELLVSFFDKVGIALKEQYHNWPTFLKRVANRQSQMYRIGWLGDYPDAENFMQLFYGKNVSPGPNRSNYFNPEFDRIYLQACATADIVERNRLWRRAQEIIREDCPWIFLHFQKDFSLAQARILHYKPSDFSGGTEKYLRTRRLAP